MSRIVVCLVLACATATVRAEPDPDGKRLFDEGRELLAAGKQAEACDRFAASYLVDPAPGTALNLAECAAQREDFVRAHALYRAAEIAYLRAGQTSRAQYARDRAAALPALPLREPAPPAPRETPAPPSRHTTAKIALGAALGVALLSGIAALYDEQNLTGYADSKDLAFDASGKPIVDSSQCGEEVFGNTGDFRASCQAQTRLNYVELPLLVASSLAAVGVGVYLLTRHDEPAKKLAIVPAVTPHVAGAALEIRW